MRITFEVEKQILKLNRQKYTKDEIADLLHVSRRSIFNILKKNRVPKMQQQDFSKDKTINDVVSIHLLKNCEDIELLTKMFASTICYQKIEKVIVPERIFKVVDIKKIKKIVSLVERAGLQLDVEYGNKIFA